MMRHWKIILPLIIIAAVGVINWPAPRSYIPEKLWGVWKTGHDRYADRYLDISEAIFTLGQGQDNLKVLFVQRVESGPAGEQERFTLHYRDHEDSRAPLQRFTFYYLPEDTESRIVLKNQPSIFWYRETEERLDHAEPRGAAP